MNRISKVKISDLGYRFISGDHIPQGEDEYYLRNQQHKKLKSNYRQLSAYDIEVLVNNNNTSSDWTKIYVTDKFDPKLVKRCEFYGMVRIGALENYYLDYHDMKAPVGLYDSTIISCDLGDNVVVNNVKQLSHYIIGDQCILININEMTTSNNSKFGNGIIKKDEGENVRIELEICNENRGRSVLPFEGMLGADAYIWSKYRGDHDLMDRLKQITDRSFDSSRGYYGVIKERSVIKNCLIVKNVNVGSDAYIKGCNKLKNLTVNSSVDERTQIGEGVELVNGIVGYGCRIFYGVKAVRFVMGTNSCLKYGARLINSYLGENSTISCCEVLNSLIFASHEQHHNNSFLCAATLLGQTNLAAGATIGSNHNSRAADGEIVAGRGFWPGLCVSLKHNSKFASFTLISKGDYPAEINLPIPFSLLINDEAEGVLKIMPGYWFFYNMYALSRNSWKYGQRDKRRVKYLNLEFDFLAPDTINEISHSIRLFEEWVGLAVLEKDTSREELIKTGRHLLENEPNKVKSLRVFAPGIEASKRKTEILKISQTYNKFKNLIVLYAVQQMLSFCESENPTPDKLLKEIELAGDYKWVNLGGQLVPEKRLKKLLGAIKDEEVNNWGAIHAYYKRFADVYKKDKFRHAISTLKTVFKLSSSDILAKWVELLQVASKEAKDSAQAVYDSRKKDYEDPFRKMTFDSQEEMDAVIGKFEDNEFIKVAFDQRDVFLNLIKKYNDYIPSEFTSEKQSV